MNKPHVTYRALRTAPKAVRIAVGILLVIGGVFGFLPVLGFWMIPLGLVVIFYDVPWVRGRWRKFRTWWKRRRGQTSGPLL